ncbi:MAG: helix-turn-helix domain-containing protein [Planctomycetota bacterium]|nr:helix-turn-helix domain-containing protein [Planctomycetota bacterium]
MVNRIRRNRKLTAEEVAQVREARAEFTRQPSKAQLLNSPMYIGPMSIEEYLAWRKGAGMVPLAQQLQAALAATGQSLYAIAQASGVAAPVLQRFVNGERGITLETAGKLAAYLGLALLPDLGVSGPEHRATI